MFREKQEDVSDPNRLRKFLRKDYRDGYMQTQVQSGIAYQMQALRKKLGVTQLQMAEKLAKTQSVVSRLEDTDYGRVSVQTLLDVASALDVALLVQFVDYPDFLTRTEDMSEGALQVETVHESIFRLENLQPTLHPSLTAQTESPPTPTLYTVAIEGPSNMPFPPKYPVPETPRKSNLELQSRM